MNDQADVEHLQQLPAPLADNRISSFCRNLWQNNCGCQNTAEDVKNEMYGAPKARQSA